MNEACDKTNRSIINFIDKRIAKNEPLHGNLSSFVDRLHFGTMEYMETAAPENKLVTRGFTYPTCYVYRHHA